MGKSYTPKYRVEVWDGSGKWQQAWSGRVSDRALETWIMKYTDSLKVGGANYHLSTARGYIPVPSRAKIVNQKTGETVATWKAPKFMAF